jgi:hypothetical protein
MESCSYNGILRFDNNLVKINGQRVGGFINYSSKPIFSEFTFSTNSFNFSQFIFAGITGYYSYFNFFNKLYSLFTFENTLDIRSYDSYFIDNKRYGSMASSDIICGNLSDYYRREEYANSITFYDDDGGVIFVYSKPVNLSFCSSDEIIRLKVVNANMSSDFRYRAIFFDGNYEVSRLYLNEPIARVGLSQVLSGINSELLNSFNMTPSEARAYFGFPLQNDFRIVVYDYATQEYFFDYQTSNPDVASNIYAKERFDYILSKNGELKKVVVGFMTW